MKDFYSPNYFEDELIILPLKKQKVSKSIDEDSAIVHFSMENDIFPVTFLN